MARIGEKRKAYRILVGKKPEGNRVFESLAVDGMYLFIFFPVF